MPYYSGSFLVARSVLEDPNFRQTVVLLLQHSSEGAFGLVVNRPASVKGLPFPVFNGGPCQAQGLLMLHGHPEWEEEETEEAEAGDGVAPGIFLGDAACLKRATESPSDADVRYRVFSGYAGWGSGQLENELTAGAWSVLPATGDVLFDVPVEDLWDRLVPPRIPQPSLN